jgi:hypothetical protein
MANSHDIYGRPFDFPPDQHSALDSCGHGSPWLDPRHMVFLGVASGGSGSNMSPFMAEQYTRRKPVIRRKGMDAYERRIITFFFPEIRGVEKIVDPQMFVN